MKQSFRILFVGMILLIFIWVSMSMASNGREVFLNKCGSCHQENGDVKAFAPSKYASTQWRRFFRRNKHKRKKDISELFTESELKDVMEYLIRHAADSDQPEAVGLK
ncbi:cytochrome CBB3 [Candidatus Magnetomorum sp. HK-1]|nr:cytochrome CBB3 [Candidatus Magnetomorum sp. HK-1]